MFISIPLFKGGSTQCRGLLKGAWNYQLSAIYTFSILDFEFDDDTKVGDRNKKGRDPNIVAEMLVIILIYIF
jgi:hypothetical protein